MLRAHGLTAVLLIAIACNTRPAAPPAAADATPPPPWAMTVSPARVKIEANSSEPQLTRLVLELPVHLRELLEPPSGGARLPPGHERRDERHAGEQPEEGHRAAQRRARMPRCE